MNRKIKGGFTNNFTSTEVKSQKNILETAIFLNFELKMLSVGQTQGETGPLDRNRMTKKKKIPK